MHHPFQNSYVETLTPSVMAFRCGGFGRKLGLYEVMRMGLVPLQEETRELLLCHVRLRQEDSHLQAMKGVFTRPWIYQHLDRGPPSL